MWVGIKSEGGIPIEQTSDSSLQSAAKSHQLRNGLNNLDGGMTPAIWICLSLTRANAQLKDSSADHPLFSSCHSKPPQHFSFKKAFAAKFKLLRLLEGMKPSSSQLQHLGAQTPLWYQRRSGTRCRRSAEDKCPPCPLRACPVRTRFSNGHITLARVIRDVWSGRSLPSTDLPRYTESQCCRNVGVNTAWAWTPA